MESTPTMEEVSTKIEEAHKIFKTAITSFSLSDKDKTERCKVAVFLAEQAVIKGLKIYAEENDLELTQDVYLDVRTIYNELVRQSKSVFLSRIRSNIGLLSSYHSSYGIIIKGKKLSDNSAYASVLDAAASICEMLESYISSGS